MYTQMHTHTHTHTHAYTLTHTHTHMYTFTNTWKLFFLKMIRIFCMPSKEIASVSHWRGTTRKIDI